MSSPFAEEFNDRARPLLFAVHGETVRYRDSDGERDLVVVWKRADPDEEDEEGLGAETFRARATAVVRIDDLPEPSGAGELIRADEAWAIRLVELQDAWTWVLHLAIARDELNVPEGLRG